MLSSEGERGCVKCFQFPLFVSAVLQAWSGCRGLSHRMLPVRHQLLRAAVAERGHKTAVGAPQVGEFVGAGVHAA